MIKNFNKIISVAFCFILVTCFMILPIYANKRVSDVEQIFPKNEVNKLLRDVQKMPIYTDYKGSRFFKMANRKKVYPSRKGVILVTADKFKDKLPLGHAAIIYNKYTVIEAEFPYVTTGNNDWNYTKKTCYGLNVKGTTLAQDNDVADWCYRQIGKRYNFNYLNTSTREEFYCSQLVWAGFKDVCGVNLNTPIFGDAIHPMELVKSNRTYIIYEK